MFPRGAPGVGLLLLRVFLGAEIASNVEPGTSGLNLVLVGALLACALAILVGIATPIAAILAILIEMIDPNTHFARISLHSFAPPVIGIALALLGPGAFSVDARWFGRRLMQFGPDDDDSR